MSKLLDLGLFENALDFYEIRFMDVMGGMKTGLCDIAVIGEQE